MAKSSKLAGLEASAVSLMSRAVELDAASRFQESLTCYQEGIQLLMNVIKETTDGAKKIRYRQKISDYMDRAEQIKQQVCKEKEAGKYHEQIKIPDNGIGYSYSKLFQPYLDNTLKEVWVNDPYIRQIHQITNLQRFCEMLLKGPAKVKIINLLTTQDDVRHTKEQTNSLEELRKSLQNYGVILNIKYSNTLHDREIRFNNGWIIKIGRGLDYFKKHQGRFSIGYWDYDLRQCHETTVDIFHCQHTKEA